jgi:hypothetical protein
VKTHGFKVASCQSGSYLCYIIEPHTLLEKVIRSLRKDFHKIAPMVLSDEALTKKPLGRKTVRSKSSQNNKVDKHKKSSNEYNPKKKSTN